MKKTTVIALALSLLPLAAWHRRPRTTSSWSSCSTGAKPPCLWLRICSVLQMERRAQPLLWGCLTDGCLFARRKGAKLHVKPTFLQDVLRPFVICWFTVGCTVCHRMPSVWSAVGLQGLLGVPRPVSAAAAEDVYVQTVALFMWRFPVKTKLN